MNITREVLLHVSLPDDNTCWSDYIYHRRRIGELSITGLRRRWINDWETALYAIDTPIQFAAASVLFYP